MTKNRRLKAVNYNAGDIEWYRSTLIKNIRAMNKDVRATILNVFDDNPLTPVELANDANPVSFIKRALSQLASKWIDRFISQATTLSGDLAKKTNDAVDRNLKSAARQQGLTIQMQFTEAMDERKDAIIAENVSLIRSIPEKYFTEVEGMVYRAVAKGGDRKQLADDLMKSFAEREGITRRRAEFIARDQVRKATSALSAVRQQAAGIEDGEWVHSGNHHRARPSHLKAGNAREVFKLSEGLFLDGEWVMPGQLPNCSCSWRPVIKW